MEKSFFTLYFLGKLKYFLRVKCEGVRVDVVLLGSVEGNFTLYFLEIKFNKIY